MTTTRKKQAEQTKQKILAAAHQIVRNEGIHALSSLKVINQAGVSKGGFFHHFPQIEDLYLYMLDQLVQRLDEDLAPGNFTTLQAFIHATSEYTMQLLENAPESVTTLFYFLSQSHHKPEYRKRLQLMLDSMFEHWSHNISHFFRPDLTAEQRNHITRILDMYFCGFSFHFLLLGDKAGYRKISAQFAEMLADFVHKEESHEK
ncbi:TetR/AcrR family transcriptional regulator [Vibrio mangrovi]|uniref:DNA-binding transcriptional repressor AcrR n=1 Tax=Vibrio mangrovi TaxID=474394 RepID=A0A1Y6IMI1_9VIBR|nr:TetR/AcrR family transcriptional regulator [Vibrio mangrovi]MDW6004327.1 TetR/AcrR family transcriptional regulator [Vibrio mangrovi]SMR98874.1 DNA-binding transcriptional repressor AcrR [Vibrio mangrovi]